MRPSRTESLSTWLRQSPIKRLFCPALALVACYLVSQLFASEPNVPGKFVVAEPSAPLASFIRQNGAQYEARPVQHSVAPPSDAGLPSYLRTSEPLPALPGGPLLSPADGETATPAAPPTISRYAPLPPMEAREISPYPAVRDSATVEQPKIDYRGMPRPQDQPLTASINPSQVQPRPEILLPLLDEKPQTMPVIPTREVYTGTTQPQQEVVGAVPVDVRPRHKYEIVDHQADRHVREAFSLAERGALYSARAELIQALRLVTQTLDAQEKSNRHSEALAAGLRALEESQDFVPNGTQLEADLNLAGLITSHRTPVLKTIARDPEQLTSLTPMLAVQRYLLFAQEQLVVACGKTPAGSLSLYGLGRLQMAMAELSAEAPRRRHPQAMTLYQAAVASDSGNYLAANELGVMLARYGRTEAAKEMLQLAARESSRAETWHNLALVHQRLGERDLASRASQEFATAKVRQNGALRYASDNGLTPPTVKWVSPEEFSRNQTGPLGRVEQTTESKSQPTKQAANSKPASKTSWLMPWNTKKR